MALFDYLLFYLFHVVLMLCSLFFFFYQLGLYQGSFLPSLEMGLCLVGCLAAFFRQVALLSPMFVIEFLVNVWLLSSNSFHTVRGRAILYVSHL
jgi:hypothetical protein